MASSIFAAILFSFFIASITIFGVHSFPENNIKNDGQPKVYYGVEDGVILD